MKRLCIAGLSACAVVTALASSSPARAEDMLVAGVTSRPVAEAHTGGLNRYLLGTGLFTLGASYVPALVVASESEVDADQHLYVPVVGPWLDLANREDCASECSGEPANRVLLATDGVFQGLGALQILGSFIQPETSAVLLTQADGAPAISFRVQPANIGRGSGVVATGKF